MSADGQPSTEKIYGQYTNPKRCTDCQESKPLSDFNTFRRNGRLYYRPHCNACRSKSEAARNKVKREADRDGVNARQRELYNSRPDVVQARIERERVETERLCAKCGKTKPIGEFAKGNDGKPRHTCRKCKNDQLIEWRSSAVR